MAKIVLQQMQFHARIGVYAEEQAHGNDFLVDVTLNSDDIRSLHDELTDTLDYVVVYELVKALMERRYQLMESAVQDIIAGIRTLPWDITGVTVKMSKLHPPVGGVMHSVSVEMEG